MATWEDNPAIVLDNGSGMVKFGFAGDDAPRTVFPAVVGHPRGAAAGSGVVVGEDAVDALNKGSKLTMNYPLEHGIVTSWEDMERVWRKAYQTLGIEPGQQAVLATEAPMNPKVNREKMAQVLFESVGAPALHIQVQAVLALYSNGRTEGLVLDSGDGITHAVPVYESRTVPTAIKRMDLAGRDLTEWMMSLLSDETECPYSTTAHREAARSLKETQDFCYVAEDFQLEIDKSDDETEVKAMEKEIKLPDGNTFNVAKARFCCPELLFEPALNDKACQPIHQVVHDSIWGCPIDIRKALLENIMLSGGSTMFKGMERRLERELKKLLPAQTAELVNVVAPAERKYSIWMGGAVLASLGSFSQEWITKQEYEEGGPAIIHKRCDNFGFVEK